MFTLYWGYGFGWEYLQKYGLSNLDYFTYIYFGFGQVIVLMALIGFLAPSNKSCRWYAGKKKDAEHLYESSFTHLLIPHEGPYPHSIFIITPEFFENGIYL